MYNFFPIISVIVPCYNVEKYIHKCIYSILNQTYKKLEVILIDDGSTDSTGNICDDFQKIDNRIKVIHKKNGGLSSARNCGLSVCTGDFIAFVDSDDYIKPEMYETLIKIAIDNNLDVIKCNFIRCYENDVEEDYSNETGDLFICDREQAMINLITSPYNRRKHFKINVWDALYKKNAISNISFPEGLIYEDGYYTPLVLLQSNKVGHLDKTLYCYRINNQSIMSSGLTEKSLDSLDDWEFIYSHLKEKMPVCADLAALRWVTKLLTTYDELVKREDIDLNDKHKNHIINKIKTNKDYFLSIINDELLKSKIALLSKSPKKYYKKFSSQSVVQKIKCFFQKHILVLKISIKFILNEYKDLLLALNNYIKKPFRKSRTLFLLGTPYHNNIGDYAIVLGEYEFFRIYFPGYKIIEFRCETNSTKLKLQKIIIKSLIKKRDLIFLHGGGNLGDIYPLEENYRRDIICTFKKIKTIVFSQTMCFYNSQELAKSARIYNSHRDLSLFLRDATSYNNSKQIFYNCNCFICPDMATILINKFKFDEHREGVIFILRKDKEKFYSDEERTKIIQDIKKDFFVEVTDNAFTSTPSIEQRNEEVFKYLKFISKHQVIVTDRFHGMIFALLTRTPCVAIRSTHHKIIEGFDWFKDCGGIFLANDLNEVKENIYCATNSQFNDSIDFEKYFTIISEIGE